MTLIRLPYPRECLPRIGNPNFMASPSVTAASLRGPLWTHASLLESSKEQSTCNAVDGVQEAVRDRVGGSKSGGYPLRRYWHRYRLCGKSVPAFSARG